MTNRRFNLLFTGKLVAGQSPPQVLTRLCSLLGLGGQQVRELFKGGAGAVILSNLGGNEAYQMREKLMEAGALCELQEILPSPSADPASVNPPKSDAPHGSRAAQERRPVWQPPAPPTKSGPNLGIILKIVAVLLLLGTGWWAYQTWFAPPSAAYLAYTGFAEALAREEYQKAADSASGAARSYAEARVAMMAPTTMKIYGRELSMNKPTVSSIAGDISWIKHKRKSEKKEGNHVTLQVEQTVCRIPPGVSSALCKWPVTFQHDVEVAQVDGIWKISAFKEERLTPQQ